MTDQQRNHQFESLVLWHLSCLQDRQTLTNERLDSIQRTLKENAMHVGHDFEALRVAINDATNKIAARLDDLSGQVKNSMTDEEVATLKAGFQSEVDRLTGLAQNPTNPVP